MKVFLDDVRMSYEPVTWMHQRIGKENTIYLEEWEIVRNYDEFIKIIKDNYNDITHVSFDHDLADIHYDPLTWVEGFEYKEKTGYDCAKWMKSFYEEKKLKLPVIYIHSMNVVGTENIKKLFMK